MTGVIAGCVLTAVGVGLLLLGFGYYRGRGRFRVTTAPSPTFYFATAWLGAAAITIGVGDVLGGLVPHPVPWPVRVVDALLLLAFVGLVVVGLVGIFWLPPAFTPAWYRAWRADGADRQAFASWEYLTWVERRSARSLGASRSREQRRRRRMEVGRGQH